MGRAYPIYKYMLPGVECIHIYIYIYIDIYIKVARGRVYPYLYIYIVDIVDMTYIEMKRNLPGMPQQGFLDSHGESKQCMFPEFVLPRSWHRNGG